MKLVDTIVCVGCGSREYSASKGKSARTQNGVCEKCQPMFPEVKANAESTAKSGGK